MTVFRGEVCLETPLRAKQTRRGAEEHRNPDANPARNPREPCYTPSLMPNGSFFEVPISRFTFAEDKLLRISENGEILDEISLIEVFVNSNELGLLTLTGSMGARPIRASRPDFDREIFHLKGTSKNDPFGMRLGV